jgi:hypothetical protein
LDEVGGFSGSIQPIGAGEFLVFRAPFRAEVEGIVSFAAGPADLVTSEVLVYGENELLAKDQIHFGSVSVAVLSPRDPSAENAPAPGFLAVLNSDPLVPLDAEHWPGNAGALDPIVWAGWDVELLLGSATSVPGNREPNAFHTDRVSDAQSVFGSPDLVIRSTDRLDLAQVAYRTIQTMRLPSLDEVQIDDDEDEWIALVDRLFSQYI